MTPNDLKSTFVDMQARDYFSNKGMEYIDMIGRMNYSHESMSKIVNEGIPYMD